MNLMKKDTTGTMVESKRGNEYRIPPTDILETDNEYEIYFDIPGVEKDDINLKVEKGVLTLTADCTKKLDEGFECLRNEMALTGYRRSFELGEGVNSEAIAADYANGTLKLTVPKKEERKTRQIKIQVS